MNKSFVLRALRIFGLEEILNLAQGIKTTEVSLKKAAGAELIDWDDAPTKHSPKRSEPEKQEAKVLPFKKNQLELSEEKPQPVEGQEEESSNLLTTEMMLWQRELNKEHVPVTKKDAMKGYHRSTEMYVVKTANPEGKEKIRFASTNGVLVNKKQA